MSVLSGESSLDVLYLKISQGASMHFYAPSIYHFSILGILITYPTDKAGKVKPNTAQISAECTRHICGQQAWCL